MMTYIYDILLNWQDDYVLDFFEWEESDNLEHIKKMPILKVNEEVIDNLYNNIIKIDSNILEILYSRTERYEQTFKNIDYAAILTDEKRVIAIEFDKYGQTIAKSSLLMEEENEIISISHNLSSNDVIYEIIKLGNKEIFLTKEEKIIKKFLYNEIMSCEQESKLKYLYNEIFEADSEINIKHKLLESLKEITNKHKMIFNLLKKV
ncbi:MAG: DUF3603 family protein [Bacilli bacterium]